MKHASLFTGIGGFDLAAQWMGWENIFQVENDTFCQKVLIKNFPRVKRYEDIKEFNGENYRTSIDVLSGGFPCQPYSIAGQRKGTEDPRHLWPEMLRVIREVRPRFVVGENVYGLINWSKGLVFEQVQTDLENEGYEVQAVILPACSVNAPHKRDRIWFVANACGFTSNVSIQQRGQDKAGYSHFTRISEGANVANFKIIEHANRKRCKKLINAEKSIEQGFNCGGFIDDWSKWPTQPGIRGRNDGIPNRMDRIKSLGNAIVPQVAFQIFKTIDQIFKDYENVSL